MFLIFCFHLSLAPCIKTHNKRQEMALKRLYFSKFSWGASPGPPRGSPPRESGKFLYAAPKFLSPYAYGSLAVIFSAV